VGETNQYRELEDKVIRQQKAIAELEERLESNQIILSDSENQLLALKEKIAIAVAEGRSAKEIEALEKDRAAMEKTMDRTTMGIEKLEVMIGEEQKKLSTMFYEMDKFFNEKLSMGFLRKEIKRYDKAYDELMLSLIRLIACQSLMRNKPDGLVYWRKALGPASDYVGATQVVRINNFSISQVSEIKGLLNPDYKLMEQVQKDILNGD
jgi:hypothetical protein